MTLMRSCDSNEAISAAHRGPLWKRVYLSLSPSIITISVVVTLAFAFTISVRWT
jgi:hypothetical protein